MTKKDYVAIAWCIKREYENIRLDGDNNSTRRTVYNLAKRLAKVMKSDNPNFNHSTFMTACGFNSDS
jgi:hypothetical protein